MGNTKHTQGKWSYDSFSNIWVDNKTKVFIPSIDNQEESEANAKLIASAPEMLEALKQIRDILISADHELWIEHCGIDRIIKRATE